MSSISTGVDPEVARWTRKWKHWIAEPMRRRPLRRWPPMPSLQDCDGSRVRRPPDWRTRWRAPVSNPLVEPDSGRLQNRQAVAAPRLVGSTPAPLRYAESGMVERIRGTWTRVSETERPFAEVRD